MNIRQLLDDRITAALHALGAPANVTAIVKPSARPEFGDYQANGVMAAAKQLKLNPRELATRLLETLDLSDLAEKLEVAGPGFINIHLKNVWLAEMLVPFGSAQGSVARRLSEVEAQTIVKRRNFACGSVWPFDFAQGERMLLIRCGRRW